MLPAKAWQGALLCLLLAACGPQQTTELTQDQSQAIDRLLNAQLTSAHVPGAAIAVIMQSKVAKRATKGVADTASAAPVTAATPFQLASTTKTFTSVGVMKLVEDGRLKLDTRAGDLLDGLPDAWRAVTVRQLLSHTSGLPDIVRTPGKLELIAASWEEAEKLIHDAPMQFAPGTRWAYTQTNYVLLAKIIEKLSATSFEQFLNVRLFRPLDMRDTFFAGTDARKCAANYERGEDGASKPRDLTFPAFVHAAGGLCSSLDDLVRWNIAIDEGRVLPPVLLNEVWTAARLPDGTTTGYGLGWVVDTAQGRRAVGHSGGNSTAYRKYPDDRMTVIVLHNGVLDPDGLVSSIAEIVQGKNATSAQSAQESLWEAAKSGDTAAIAKALDAGADIEALDTRKSRGGRRALNWAAWFNRAEAIRLLLARGAKIEAENNTGFTALHHAAEAGSLDAAKALLAAGANPKHANKAGDLPADTARSNGHPELADLIAAVK